MKIILLILCVSSWMVVHAQEKQLTIEYSESRNCYVLVSDRAVDAVSFTKYNKKKKINDTVKKIVLNSKMYEIPQRLIDKSDRLIIIIGTFFVMIDLKEFI